MTALWITAALFVAVIVGKIFRDARRPEDPSNPYDI